MKIGAVVAVLCVCALPALAATNLVQNGSFEMNGGPNSNILNGWSSVDEVGGNGMWVAQTGKIGPVTSSCGPDDVEAPPDGMFAAMTTQASQGSHVLYQDVAIPAGATAVLSFQFYVRSAAGLFSPDTLSYQAGTNQQFRVDIIDPSSNPFTLNVLQNVLAVGTGNPRVFGYETHTVTVSGLGGRTIRIRFAEVDNQSCFYAGVDNVRLEVDGAAPGAAIVRFTGVPPSVAFGGAATLSWVTDNAMSVEIDNGIGAVAPIGSRTVSLQKEATYTLTATGGGNSARRPVSIAVRAPGPTIRFSASPSFIQNGQQSTLTWSTTDATEVSIDNGIGVVATSGALSVTPSATTEYTLTATGSGVSTSSRATVFVDPGDVPIVSLTTTPNGIVQVAGLPTTAVDRYALTNLGRVPTTITLTQTGDFFTQSPTSFDLAAGATQVVTITPTALAAGKYEGTSIPSGAGVPSGLKIGVRLFLAVAPTGTVAPTTAVARTELAAPANENPTGSVSFTNTGTGTLQGIATSDVSWLIPQTDAVVIGPGGTSQVTFTANRALRPDAASLAGAATATLTVSYLDFGGSSLEGPQIFQAPRSGRGSISVTIIDVVKASAAPAAPQPLAPGELALFVPGLSQAPGSSGDLLVSVIGNSIADLQLFLGAPGIAPTLGSLDQIAPNAGLALPSVLQNVFATSAPTGTVQARSASLSRVSLSGMQTNTASPIGSFINALPTFRSDRSAAPGEILYLPGVERSTSVSTNLFVQEVGGLPATVKVEVLNAAGTAVSTRDGQTIAAFSLLALPDSVPAGAASVRITNTSSTAARIVAHANVVDAATGDAWTIVDPQSMAAAAGEQIVAVPPPPPGAGFGTSTMYLVNRDAAPLDVSFEAVFTPGRRRAARPNEVSASASSVTVGPRQTVALPVAVTSGFVRVTAPRPFAVSAREVHSSPARPGAFGSALPVLPSASALAVGQSRRFGSVDDASRANVAAARPLSYRSNLGLIESTGQPAVVRLTLRYTFSAGSKISAQGLSNVTVQVPANRLLMVNEIARSVIGPSRDSFGDLRNMQLDVEVISGAGRVFPFVQTIDNGSSDSALRVQ